MIYAWMTYYPDKDIAVTDSTRGNLKLSSNLQPDYYLSLPKTHMGAKKYKRWTDEEIAFLVKYYEILPTDVIAKLLGRSEISVYMKALRLGLKKSVRSNTIIAKKIAEMFGVE